MLGDGHLTWPVDLPFSYLRSAFLDNVRDECSSIHVKYGGTPSRRFYTILKISRGAFDSIDVRLPILQRKVIVQHTCMITTLSAQPFGRNSNLNVRCALLGQSLLHFYRILLHHFDVCHYCSKSFF